MERSAPRRKTFGGQANEEFTLTIWSKWFRGESTRPTKTLIPTLTVGEVVDRAEHPYNPIQGCLLCEASATVGTSDLEIQIDCAGCGQYCASSDAADALNALVKYRSQALAEMRKMLAAYRQGPPHGMPRIRVQYVVSDAVPTFYLSSD